jgi:glyoxylase-like metal-dependent hydrolase (beta-lactamase superfamily II)
VKIGDIELRQVLDGSVRVPPTAMLSKPGDDWSPHRDLLDADGMMQLDMGGCLVRTGDRVMLVDCGMGAIPGTEFGAFLTSLAALGVAPADVTDVVLTHLHFDHIGWTSDGTRPVFPNATYRCDERDWAWFVGPDAHRDEHLFEGALDATARLDPVAAHVETFRGDTNLAPGVDVREAPGHTPGSAVVVVSSGTDRAMLLGDVVHCPAELLEDEWTMIADIDPAMAARTREALARELEGSDVRVAGTHFPGLRFGRVLPGTGLRQWRYD